MICLLGGQDFWSNGIHLNVIEAAADPAVESWRNINAIDDVVLRDPGPMPQLVVAALRGNAGAGGVMLALAADHVYARQGVVLNPHYRSMGNLYGSEYWTYTLPRRVGEDAARLTTARQPMGVDEAVEIGLLDGAFGATAEAFRARVRRATPNARARTRGTPAGCGERRPARGTRHPSRCAPTASRSSRSRRVLLRAPTASYHGAHRRFVHKLGTPCAVGHAA